MNILYNRLSKTQCQFVFKKGLGFFKKAALLGVGALIGMGSLSAEKKAEIDANKNKDSFDPSTSEVMADNVALEVKSTVNIEGFENYTGPEGDPNKVWGFTLEEIEAGGGAKAFFAANKEALKAYADANSIKYKGNEKFLLIRFNSAVKLQATKDRTAKLEKEIADDKKEIADDKKEIANMNQAMLDKIKNRDKKSPSDKD